MCSLLLLVLAVYGHEERNAECGCHCLYVAMAAISNNHPTLQQLQKELGDAPDSGYSVRELQLAAEHFGYQALAVKTDLRSLGKRDSPFVCIALLSSGHFVVIAGVNDEVVHIIDPPSAYVLTQCELTKRWNGEALLTSIQPMKTEEELNRSPSWVVVLILGVVALVCLTGGVWWMLTRR